LSNLPPKFSAFDGNFFDVKKHYSMVSQSTVNSIVREGPFSRLSFSLQSLVSTFRTFKVASTERMDHEVTV